MNENAAERNDLAALNAEEMQIEELISQVAQLFADAGKYFYGARNCAYFITPVATGNRMRRRACLRWLGSALVAPVLPFATSAQQGVHRLAFVHSAIPVDKLTEGAGPFWVRRVYQTLRELGDVEGENLIVERFSADGRSERFASLAAEVVGRKPDVIILNFIELAKVFMVTTSTIPLVAIIGDPIAAGLLTSLAHPGGNLTGVSINAGIEIYGKRLQIIKEAMPKVTKVAALFSGPLSGKSVCIKRLQQSWELS